MTTTHVSLIITVALFLLLALIEADPMARLVEHHREQVQ